MIELKNITINNGSSYRLRNIDLSIQKGERVALLGKSGSGKSTLLSVVNGSLPPTIGQAKLNGLKISTLNRLQKRSIGTLWQDLRLIEELNVRQNINVGALGRHSLLWSLRNLFSDIDSDRCLSCMSQAGLQKGLISSPVSQISEGQRKRVAIARLIRQNASIVLADEPLSNLDPPLATEILNLILGNKTHNKKYSESNTFLISLHQPEFIGYFSRIIGLKNGEKIIDTISNDFSQKDLQRLYSD